MRRTLPVVLRIVDTYNIRAIEFLLTCLRLTGKKLRRILSSCLIFFNPFKLRTNLSFVFHRYFFKHLLRSKSAYYLSNPISNIFRFDHFKSITKTVMIGAFLIVLTNIAICNVKIQNHLLTTDAGSNNQINNAPNSLEFYANSLLKDFHLDCLSRNEITSPATRKMNSINKSVFFKHLDRSTAIIKKESKSQLLYKTWHLPGRKGYRCLFNFSRNIVKY